MVLKAICSFRPLYQMLDAELILRVDGQASFQHLLGSRALALLIFPWFPFAFERLSSHFGAGGCLKIVGRGPARPSSHFKMSTAEWVKSIYLVLLFT